MLKKLRHKFVAIVMALAGTVLVAVLGFTYFATYQTQRQLINDALEHTLQGDMNDRPTIGGRPPSDGKHGGGMLCLLVDVNDDGIIIDVSNAPVLVNMDVLNDVIQRVFENGELSGTDRTSHVAWLSADQDDGGRRIALAELLRLVA